MFLASVIVGDAVKDLRRGGGAVFTEMIRPDKYDFCDSIYFED